MSTDLRVGLVTAIVLHIGGFAWMASLERDVMRLPPPKQVARAVSFDVPARVKPPKPPPPAKPKEVAKPVEPPPVVKPKPVAPKPAPKQVAKARKKRKKSKRRRKRKSASKRKPTKVAAQKPKPPAPLTLSKVYDGGGGVAVLEGEEGVFGDPTVAAKPGAAPATRPRVADAGAGDEDGDDEGDDDAPAPKVQIRHARPKGTCAVVWPEDAPGDRRIVEVQLLLTVGKDGKVRDARVLRSVGKTFDVAAVAALRRCNFRPGTRNGRPFIDRVPFVVEFRPGLGA